jgi:CheY-like chemotaxis protein
MPKTDQRAVLFVVDRAKTAVDLVSGLFAPADELGRRRRKLDRLEGLTRRLCQDGYEIGLLVAGSESARQLGQSPRPDAVVVDVSTPQGGSLAVAHELRRMYPNLPVFVITSYLELVTSACAELVPAPVVFTKPLDYARFSAALARAAKKHSGEYVKIPSFLLDAVPGSSRGRN